MKTVPEWLSKHIGETTIPMQAITIEITTYCNARCFFCPHNQLTKFNKMSTDLFTKIIDDCTEIPTLQNVQILGLGEPLSDIHLFDKLRYVNKKLPKVTLWLYTNGSLLTDKILAELSTIDNLIVDFSLNGITPEERLKNMGLDDFDRVVSMIRKYSAYGKKYSVSLVNYPGTDPNEVKILENMFTGNRWIIFVNFSNWVGNIRAPQGWTSSVNANDYACSRAMYYLSVMHDGKVNLCCQDGLGAYLFGDLTKQSVKEVWESHERQEYAKQHLLNCRSGLSPCNRCTVYN